MRYGKFMQIRVESPCLLHINARVIQLLFEPDNFLNKGYEGAECLSVGVIVNAEGEEFGPPPIISSNCDCTTE